MSLLYYYKNENIESVKRPPTPSRCTVVYAACDERPRVLQPVQRTTSGRTVELRDYKVPPGALSKWPLPDFLPAGAIFQNEQRTSISQTYSGAPSALPRAPHYFPEFLHFCVLRGGNIWSPPAPGRPRALSLLLFVIC